MKNKNYVVTKTKNGVLVKRYFKKVETPEGQPRCEFYYAKRLNIYEEGLYIISGWIKNLKQDRSKFFYDNADTIYDLCENEDLYGLKTRVYNREECQKAYVKKFNKKGSYDLNASGVLTIDGIQEKVYQRILIRHRKDKL